MANPTARFKDGDIIFREGDASDRAFEIVAGQVEIAKAGSGGDVELARLGPGEMLGEMGIIDRGSRSATARAVGDVTLRVIERDEFLDTIQNKPDVALEVMSKLAERLRAVDDRLANPDAAPAPPPPAAPSEPGTAASGPAALPPGGLIGQIIGRFKSSMTRIEVRVAQFSGQDPDAQARHVLKALSRHRALKAKAIRKPLEIDINKDLMQELTVAGGTARTWLAEQEADLLIWGYVPPPGVSMHLHFVSLATRDEDAPGAFDLTTDLALPADFGPEFADFLQAVALAATVPSTEEKRNVLAAALPAAVERAGAAFGLVPEDLTSRERASLSLCYGNALAATAQRPDGTPYCERAVVAYRDALSGLSERETPLDWAITQKHLGSILQNLAEADGQRTRLEDAMQAFRAALRVLTRDRYPLEWAALQNRLGLALYHLDFDSGDTEVLKHALAAFQSALQVYTRKDAPRRWADVTSNFAQAAQVLGEQLKSIEALDTAVKALRSVLEVRKKREVPMLWAATQNNLGSALFMLARHSKDVAHLEQAAEAFDLALGLYEARNADNLAAITAKNLTRVNKMLDDRQPKGGPRMDWEPDDAPAAVESPLTPGDPD